MPAPNSIHWPMTIGLALGATLCFAASASAQDGYPADFDPRLRYVPPQPTLEELRREYDSIHILAPAIGIPVSYFTAGGGLGLIMAGSLDFDLCFTVAPCDEVEEPLTPGERATLAAGSVILVGGVAGLVASIVRLRQKNSRRRELRYQMAALYF